MMRERPSSRLLVIDPLERILLFRFEHKQGSLAGQRFWATPGGALDPGESYARAACRELLEETGLVVDDPGPEVGQRIAVFQMPDGETVHADERFFLVRVDALEICAERQAGREREGLRVDRWWTAAELDSTAQEVELEGLTGLRG